CGKLKNSIIKNSTFNGAIAMYKILSSSLLIAALGLSPLSHAHDDQTMHHASSGQHDEQVEQRMKQMQRAYRSAVRSQSIEQMKPAVTQLIALSKQATALHYGDNPTERADYKDGMHELQADLDELKNAIQANDLLLARKILTEQIKTTRNQAHEKLGVDED
ncbi:MAG: cytochrome b562, partial [Pseudomonadota bacterium]|nr:cytochrome b562 [Pseudomonadota bacterium]